MIVIAWGTDELIKQYNSLSSGHFFDKDTMRFFRSRATSNYRRLSDTEALFITTEKGPCDDSRKATLRRARLEYYVRSDGRGCQRIEIDTVDEFCKMTLPQAKRAMAKWGT